jgi:two-component system, NtrC family, response regulator HydG
MLAAVSVDDLSDLEEGTTDIAPKYAPAARAAFSLRVMTGPDAGKSFAIDPDAPSRALLGQSPACTIQLADRQVSRRHAALEVAGDRLHVVDLASTNGTYVGAIRIVDAFFVGDEVLRVGETSIRVERRAAGAAPPLSRQRFGNVLGQSPAMMRLYPFIERLSASTVPLVIEGETGTGKEALAEAIHECGPRASGPFVVFDCTAVAPNLMEAELFGHQRGAFTGAVTARAGVFEQAHGGTLLIDEIGDLDLSLQPKLLRTLERSEIRRIGGDRVQKVDVRFIAATRRDLDQEVTRGRFRDDLFYRLAVGRIELPPLRERTGDIALLARHFWTQLGGDPALLPPDALARWETSPWPGNIRQLRNAVASQLALGEYVDEEHFAAAEQDFIGQVIDERAPLPVARLKVVREFERRYIEAVLAEHGGNVVHAAKASGIARRYFQILRGGTRR